MQRIGNLYETLISFENLYFAYKKALKGNSGKISGLKFAFHLEEELINLLNQLQTNTYQPSGYTYFKIFDPKERTIAVAPFRDRVLHHAIINIIEPIYERVFIYDSYATRKGKGTHKAVKRSQEFLKKNKWYFKTDIEKYFDSVDHKILMQIVERKIKDKQVVCLIEKVISSGGLEGKGLPIGNLTSQFLANVYLDPLDHYIKDHLSIKYYVRYMDDFVLFSNDKIELKGFKKEIESFLANKLQLKLKGKSTFINQRLNGLPFLGRRIFPSIIRLKRENLQRVIRKIRLRKTEFFKGILPEKKFNQCIMSMIGYINTCNSVNLNKSIFL